MSTSTGAIPCRLATRAAKEPAIRDGPSLGRKRRESRDDRKLRTSRPGRLWLFTHSAAAPAGDRPHAKKENPAAWGERALSGRVMAALWLIARAGPRSALRARRHRDGLAADRGLITDISTAQGKPRPSRSWRSWRSWRGCSRWRPALRAAL